MGFQGLWGLKKADTRSAPTIQLKNPINPKNPHNPSSDNLLRRKS
jgi:hypothetical protein